jgi:alcohol dehydrogenase
MIRQSYRLTAGNLGNMKIETDTLPDPAENEVSVQVKAIGLNFADIFAIWGLYSATPKGVFTPGLEYAGVVCKTGKSVTRFREGDRVMGITRFGAYTTHLNIDQRYLAPLPETWSFEQGAAYPVQALTAYYGMVVLGDLQKGQTVLIHSAAGGVGLWAGRIAKKFDAYTIGTIGSASKLDFLKAEGFDRVIVRNPQTFKADLSNALDGKPLHVLMECIGGKIFQAGYEALAPMGRAIIYGSARYAHTGNRPNFLKIVWKYLWRPKIDPQAMTNRNVGVFGFNLIWLYENVELMNRLLVEIEALQLEKPYVGHVFEFNQLPDAIRLFQGGSTMGKVVCFIDD